MMNRLLLYLISVAFVLGSCQTKRFYYNPVIPNGADPWVIKHEGNYYYCCGMQGNRIGVSKSDNLHQINKPISVWQAPDGKKWNSTCIWAPELHYWKGKWYIYYAAGYSGPPFIHQKAGVLESVTSEPQGEYVDKGMLFTGDSLTNREENRWAIDMTLLELNERLYAVWSGWETKESTDKTQQHLYIAEMDNPWTISSGRVKISSPDKWYEQGNLPLNEGPQILKHDNDIFIVYSCGQSWLSTYKLAYLRLKNDDADPLCKENWEKGAKPLFEGTNEVFGVGHASFTLSPDGKEHYILYHSKINSTPGWQREIRLQKFVFDKKTGLPVFGKPIPSDVKLKLPSGTK